MRKFAFATIALVLVGCSNDRPEQSRSPDLARAAAIRDKLITGEGSSTTETPEDVGEPTGFVTLKGTITYAGDVPAPGTLVFSKPECGNSGPDRTLLVNSANKGVKNVLIYADRVPDTWVHESARAIEGEAVFDQQKCLFLSPILAVNTSQQLVIKNSDPFGHNTKFDAAPNPSINVSIPGNSSTNYQPQAGVSNPFPVSCTVHPWMKSYMIFRENAYFAVTDENGKFEITNVPAGVPVRWRIWHEHGQSMRSILLDGQKKTLSRGALTYTLEGEADLQFTIPADQLN